MPSNPPLWTDFLLCSSCGKEFSLAPNRLPITLLCGHSVCQDCVRQVQTSGCQYDPNTTTPGILSLGTNYALLQLIQKQELYTKPADPQKLFTLLGENYIAYSEASNLLECLAIHLSDIKNGILPQKCDLTKPMLRKLVTLIQSQLALEEGRLKALRACRALGERASTELILSHQNPTTLSVNLWTAVRARGCQFLGPAMQEEALKLILLALEDGSELSRKVLVMFVVQKLQRQFPLASKTSIGHVVQLLYRASCFVVKKRDGDSSLMKLKEVYRTYPALRREHDAQVVQIAREAGLRIAPDQWSALLYGDQEHKSHMQSVIDRLQSGESLRRCIQDLRNALEKSSDPNKLRNLIPHFEELADVSAEAASTQNDDQKNDWKFLIKCLQSVKVVIHELIDFTKNHTQDFRQDEETLAQSAKFKTSFCRDMKSKGRCPRDSSCSFAHTEEELHFYRNKRKKAGLSGLVTRENAELKQRSPGTFSMDKEDESLTLAEERQFNVDRTAQIQSQQSTLDQGPYSHQNSFPSTFHHPPVLHQHRGVQNLGMYPSQPVLRPPLHAGDGYHTPMYGTDIRYNQNQFHNMYETMRFNAQPPYHSVVAQSSNYPIRHPAPQLYSAAHNRLSNEHITGNVVDQGLQQFTVTLSIQSKPSSTSTSIYQHGYHSNSMPDDVRISPAVGSQQRQYDEKGIGSTFVAPVRPMDRTMQQYPPSSKVVQNQEPVNPVIMHQRHPSTFEQQAHHRVITPASYRLETPVHNRDSAPIAVVAPQPATPNVMGPSHMYEPGSNVLISNNPMQPPTPYVMSPASHQTQNHPVLIPVVPVTQYQVVDPSQVQFPTQDDDSVSLEESESLTTSAAIPISIDRATVEQLEERKKQILKKMIQNQGMENEGISSIAPSSSGQLYNVWNCESYSPLLTLQTAVSVLPENLQCEDYSTNVVDVIAEIDTGTTQVTMRGTNDVNPSYAKNQRTLDDTKMHRMLIAKNDDLNNSETDAESSQPLQALIHYSSGLQDDGEDDIIPFSDRPTVSKYGPIARSVRTRPSNTELVQVNANADVDTNSVAATNESGNSRPPKSCSRPTAYSSLESVSAISYFPASFPRNRENLALQNSKNHPNIPTGTGNLPNRKISPIQAASNSKLLHREETAIQQNKSLNNTENLQLATELQQIEIGIHQKRTQNT